MLSTASGCCYCGNNHSSMVVSQYAASLVFGPPPSDEEETYRSILSSPVLSLCRGRELSSSESVDGANSTHNVEKGSGGAEEKKGMNAMIVKQT